MDTLLWTITIIFVIITILVILATSVTKWSDKFLKKTTRAMGDEKKMTDEKAIKNTENTFKK